MTKFPSNSTVLKVISITAIVALVLFVRFWRLSEIPTGFVHDEMIYLMQAKALAFTGSSVDGTWRPFSLVPFNLAFAELPSVFLTLTVPWVRNPFLGGRILHAVMGFSIPFLLGLTAQGIWKNRKLSILVVLLGSVNPWIWQYSRMPFDPLFSLFFYLLASTVLFHFKSWWKLLAVLCMFLGFYQYQGHKLLFLPFVIGVVALFLEKDSIQLNRWKIKIVNAKNIWISSILFFSCLALFLFYVLFALPQQSASSRLNQLRTPASEQVSFAVNKDRRLSLVSPLSELVMNKFGETAHGAIDTFLKIINPSNLFIAVNEAANSFSVNQHGYFYLIDFPLLLIGLYSMMRVKQNRRTTTLYVLLLLGSSLPGMLSFGQSYSFRASMFYVLLLPIIAHGVYFIVTQRQRLYAIVLCTMYVLSVGLFAFHYYTQYPVYAADSNLFSERVLANYLHRIPKNVEVFVVVPDEEFLLHSYLYYNNLYTKQSASAVRAAFTDKTFKIDTIQVLTDCTKIPDSESAVIIAARSMEYCAETMIASSSADSVPSKRHIISIPAVVDSGELFRIYHDPICINIPLQRYINPKKLHLFSVEELPIEDFCTNWFSNVFN